MSPGSEEVDVSRSLVIILLFVLVEKLFSFDGSTGVVSCLADRVE